MSTGIQPRSLKARFATWQPADGSSAIPGSEAPPRELNSPLQGPSGRHTCPTLSHVRDRPTRLKRHPLVPRTPSSSPEDIRWPRPMVRTATIEGKRPCSTPPTSCKFRSIKKRRPAIRWIAPRRWLLPADRAIPPRHAIRSGSGTQHRSWCRAPVSMLGC